MRLHEKTCPDCSQEATLLVDEEINALLGELVDWEILENGHLCKRIKCLDFISAFALAGKIAEIAESEGHHPDLLIRWGELVIELWTHKINGLTEADFILAAKIDCIQN